MRLAADAANARHGIESARSAQSWQPALPLCWWIYEGAKVRRLSPRVFVSVVYRTRRLLRHPGHGTTPGECRQALSRARRVEGRQERPPPGQSTKRLASTRTLALANESMRSAEDW